MGALERVDNRKWYHPGITPTESMAPVSQAFQSIRCSSQKEPTKLDTLTKHNHPRRMGSISASVSEMAFAFT